MNLWIILAIIALVGWYLMLPTRGSQSCPSCYTSEGMISLPGETSFNSVVGGIRPETPCHPRGAQVGTATLCTEQREPYTSPMLRRCRCRPMDQHQHVARPWVQVQHQLQE